MQFNKETQPQKRRGFTLIEILVVMGIIATLLGLGVGAIKNMSSSKGVSTAVPLADGMFDLARQVAKTGVPTRLVIYADTTGSRAEQRERHLRMIGVATGRDAAGVKVDKKADVTQWKLMSRSITIPKNTYFNANLSNQLANTSETAIFPGSNVAMGCYVYEFNSEGALVDPTNGTPLSNSRFIIQAGKLRPGQDLPIADRKNKRDVGGFKIWPNGRMAKFRSPNQIIGGDPEATFVH